MSAAPVKAYLILDPSDDGLPVLSSSQSRVDPLSLTFKHRAELPIHLYQVRNGTIESPDLTSLIFTAKRRVTGGAGATYEDDPYLRISSFTADTDSNGKDVLAFTLASTQPVVDWFDDAERAANANVLRLTGEFAFDDGDDATRSRDIAVHIKAAVTSEGDLEPADVEATALKADFDAHETQQVTDLAALDTRLGRNVVDTFIELPSFDGLDDNIHFDVVADNDGIFGYKYCAAYTGMGSNREHPQVAYSQDGITWVIPFGMPNPIVTRYADLAAAIGHTPAVIGDPDITWDGTTLRCYFIASWNTSGGGNAVMMTETTDGKTWTAPVSLFQHTNNANGSAASPAVVHEGDSNWTMYYMLHDAGAGHYLVSKRSSTDDGANWGAATTCTFPLQAGAPPWHLDVVKVGATYHALILYSYDAVQEPQGNTGTPYYLTSDDGTTFGGATLPGSQAIKWLDREMMQSCYRGCLLPDPNGAATFDVYLPCFNNYDEGAGEWSQIAVHRWRGLALLDGTETHTPSHSGTGAKLAHLAKRRAVMLDQDFVQDTTTALYAPLANRNPNPWGSAFFEVPIIDGETVHLRARLQVQCLLADVPTGDNYKVEVRPHDAASPSGFIKVRVTKLATPPTQATIYNFTWDSATFGSGLGLRTAVGAGGKHIIEVEGIISYTPGDGSTSQLAVRVHPQSDPATFGEVTVMKGSTLDVERLSAYTPDPADTVA